MKTWTVNIRATNYIVHGWLPTASNSLRHHLATKRIGLRIWLPYILGHFARLGMKDSIIFKSKRFYCSVSVVRAYIMSLSTFSSWAASWQNKQNDCAPSEDSDLPISLGIGPVWSVFPVHSIGNSGPKLSSRGQRRLWSDWADAQADLSLRRAHMPFCWFCHEAAHLFDKRYNQSFSVQLIIYWPKKRYVRFTLMSVYSKWMQLFYSVILLQ